MFEKADIDERVRDMLARLPPEMTRAQCAEFVRHNLYGVLGFTQAQQNADLIRVEWVGDKLRVEVPTRLHYIEYVIDIKRAIDDAVSRVNITDLSQLSNPEFVDRMARLRGRR